MALFKSFYIKKIRIPNRMVLSPINTGYFKEEALTQEFYNFHNDRSGRGIGICCVGNVAISKKYTTNACTAYFLRSNLSQWKKLTKLISKNGSVPAVQLGCRYSSINSIKNMVNTNIPEYVKLAAEEVFEFSEKEIEEIIDSYIEAATIAWESGFKIIQIHAAHGYFLSLMISESFNSRMDKYNCGDILILKKIILEINKRIPDVIIDIRISFYEGVKSASEEYSSKIHLIEKIIKLPVDIISISNGIYNINKHMIYPFSIEGEQNTITLGKELCDSFPGKKFSISGNLHNIDNIMKNGHENLMISFGRQLISDPHFISKYISGKTKEIKYCENCGECHYYTNGKQHINICNNKT